MRYEDWDVLLFPTGQDPKVPIKEFKVACHVVHDAEFAHSHQTFGVPMVCCFVPSLRAGTPFQVSVHSWKQPPVSHFTRSYTTFVDSVMFQARLFIDGRLVSYDDTIPVGDDVPKSLTLFRSMAFDPKSGWPHVLASSFEFSKTGDCELLKFPAFRQELLQQDHWSPADDLGRIKLLVSEGFPRDSFTTPVERVKNIVAFSFQHAPLDILEASGIAWPNQSMWQRAPHTTSKPVPSLTAENPDSHAHSPRRRIYQPDMSGYTMPIFQNTNPVGASNISAENTVGFTSQAPSDPVVDTVGYFDWLGQLNSELGTTSVKNNNMRDAGERKARQSSTDISMPDYVSLGAHRFNKSDNVFASVPVPEDDDASRGSMGTIQAPVNTPANQSTCTGSDQTLFPFFRNGASINPSLAETLTSSLLNQPGPSKGPQNHTRFPPATEVKSRKENQIQSRNAISPSARTGSSQPGWDGDREVSQQSRVPTEASPGVDSVASATKSPRFPKIYQAVEAAPRDASTSNSVASLIKEFTPDNALRIVSGNSEKNNKRARIFTPASPKELNEEDEAGRGSPRVRLANSNENCGGMNDGL